MDADLLAAYERTEYRVTGADPPFVLRIGAYSAALDAYQAAAGVNGSTFITAWNPRSAPTPLEQNVAAMARLEEALTAHGWRWLHGEGVDPMGDWPGEPSLFVPGLAERDAVALARRFDQHAVVCAAADAIPRLVLCER